MDPTRHPIDLDRMYHPRSPSGSLGLCGQLIRDQPQHHTLRERLRAFVDHLLLRPTLK